jgi:HlyD family secretion protein
MRTVESEQSSWESPGKSHRRWPMLLLAFLLLLGGGGAGWRLWTAMTAPEPAQEAQGFPPIPVETEPLAEGAGIQQVELLGQVEANQSATVRAQATGIVEQVLVEVGDRVSPDTVIATLNTADQQLALASAQANLAQERSQLSRLQVGTRPEIIAQRQAELQSAQAREQEAQERLTRFEVLAEGGAVSENDLIEARAAADSLIAERLGAEAALAEAQAGPTAEEIAAQASQVGVATAAVEQAQLGLERTQVKANTTGIVRSRQVSIGDLIESNDPLITLVNGTDLDVVLELPEDLSGTVRVGLPIELTARALPDWRAQATISSLVPSASSASRRQQVRVSLSDPPENLLPNMAVQGELQLQSGGPSLLAPRDALVRRGDQWLVFTVVEGKASEIEVQQVVDMGETVAIASDELQAGQPLVVRGGDALTEGAVVQVVESESDSSQ